MLFVLFIFAFCKKHIVLDQVTQWSPWRWCNEHRNWW